MDFSSFHLFIPYAFALYFTHDTSSYSYVNPYNVMTMDLVVLGIFIFSATPNIFGHNLGNVMASYDPWKVKLFN